MARLYSPHGGMIHLNGNLLCAIDVETTGVIPGFNDLIQVAILPLDGNLQPLKTVQPFYLNLTPQRIENIDAKAMKITKLTLAGMILNSTNPDTAADLLEDWFTKLNLPITSNSHKRIAPLWSNGSFDKSFLIEWLGRDTYNHYFYFQERDTQALALSINDRFDFHVEKIPFPKVGLPYLASCFNVVNENAHDALSDCYTTAEVYRRMLLMYYPILPRAAKPEGPPVWFGRQKDAPVIRKQHEFDFESELTC